MKTRTFGWIQDPTEIKNLRRTVEVFDNQSPTHRELIDKIIPTLVEEQDGRSHFISELKHIPLKLRHKDLKGTAFKPRKDARCNGIIQASIKGQKNAFIVDWAADNFIRWAHALGFIQYNRSSDSYSITEIGLKYSRSNPEKDNNIQLLPGFNQAEADIGEKEILSQAFLSYPPVMRVLNLLAYGEPHTKFDIGKQLGFVDEEGFTSLPQNIFVRSLALMEDKKERNKMLRNWEGTSDKYARTIARWLIHMGWVEKVKKTVVATFGNEKYEYDLDAYVITDAGLKARRRGLGTNIQSRIPKNVFWGMLATKGRSRDYIRSRRTIILQEIANKSFSIEALQQKLANKDFNTSETIILNDLKGLQQMGLNIQQEQNGYFLKDTIQNLVIPSFSAPETTKSDIQVLVDKCREHLKYVPHDFLVLIPLSFEGNRNNKNSSRLLEMKTIDLFVEQCGFNGLHLGGADRPDGLIFTQEQPEDYGIIIDTKSYKDSFNLPANERNKMVGYVNDNILRDESHPSKWWQHFPDSLEIFKFLFVSGKFGGKYKNQLDRISKSTNNILGAAITSYNLLMLAEEIKENKINLQNVKEKFSCLSEVEIE